MLNLKVKSTSKVNIKLPQDKGTPRISGCAFLPNGELLLVDHRNWNLKLLDRTLTIKNSFVLPNRPFDVSVLGTNTVVVTFPSKKKLQFIQISPSFSRGSSVQFHKECKGVVVAVGRIYVVCHDNGWKNKEEDYTPGEVCVLDIRGNPIMKFGLNDTRLRFIKPYFVAANTDGSIIYVSDFGLIQSRHWQPRVTLCFSINVNVTTYGIYQQYTWIPNLISWFVASTPIMSRSSQQRETSITISSSPLMDSRNQKVWLIDPVTGRLLLVVLDRKNCVFTNWDKLYNWTYSIRWIISANKRKDLQQWH